MDHALPVRPVNCFPPAQWLCQPGPPACEPVVHEGADRRNVMLKCRMCSQPLPRPGRLCRECERELAPAHEGERTDDALEDVAVEAGARVVESSRGGGRIRARNILLLAFCVGALTVAAAHLALEDERSTVPTRSVMLDRALHAQAAETRDPDRRRSLTSR